MKSFSLHKFLRGSYSKSKNKFFGNCSDVLELLEGNCDNHQYLTNEHAYNNSEDTTTGFDDESQENVHIGKFH